MKVNSVSSNGHDLEASGSFITYGNKKTLLKLGITKDMELTLELVFLKKEGSKQEVSAEVEGNRLSLTLYNFDNPLGTGTIHPAFIGIYDDKMLFMHYRVYAFDNDGDKLVHYSFYSQKIEKIKPTQVAKNGKK